MRRANRLQPLGYIVAGFVLVSLWAMFCQAQRPELVLQTGHASWVAAVAFSPDGRLLASGSNDGTCKLWDVATGTMLRSLKAPADAAQQVTDVAFSADGRTLITEGLFSAEFNLWDVATGSLLRKIKRPPGLFNA